MKELYIKRLQRTIALTLSLAGGLYHMAWAEPAATALPMGEEAVKNATVTRDITTNPAKPVMTINQDKGQSRAFISWDTFNIGKDATVNIKQYSGADLLINAVRGNKMSEIAGKLNATGNVALINPNGVIFMNGAQVNVGGLGVYATGYDATNNKFLASGGKEGKIEIQSGATINAGIKAVLANLADLNIAPKDYAIAIDSTGEDGYTNRIHLVADGNVEIQTGSTLTAKDYTYVGSNASVGEEGFKTSVSASGMGGKIYIRSDRDADDYGQVIITHGDDGSKPVMQSANGVSIYTNAEQVDGDGDVSNGINAAPSRAEVGIDGTPTYYTKHDYKNTPTFDINGSAYTDGTSVSVDGPGTTDDKLSNDTSDTNKNKISNSYAGNGETKTTTSLLVNNMDQLQDIEDGTYGNPDGRYVLGREINATDDAHAYIDDGVLYTKNSDGTVKKWSTTDGVEITGTTKSGGNLSKTVNGTTIAYSKDENEATTKLAKDTELSDGTKLSEETTLSNNGTVTSAENTQWSTTKGVSTVTDKKAGSTYTIQSDTKSVVDKDGRTSNTEAKTVTDKTDKDNTYTADIGGHTVTHAGDNSVTNTNTHTVTKPAGTSDTGYTATITDGTDTTAGTSGTIAIKGITYQVTNGSVGDTVTYQDSSVTTSTNGTNTVTTNGVSTQVSQDGTGTDKVKKGTIASDTVTVNGTTTTVNDGTTSYQITTGTDAVTYTKGTTSASISGTNVTTDEVSADTSAGKVVKGNTTAVITSDTAGTVTYSGQDYAVANGTVTTTDSTTGTTVTITGEDATKVLNIFSAAKTALSNAQSIYSDAAKAQSLTKTLDGAIETLKEVTEKSTPDDQVQTTFQSAARQLKSDTALFNTASTALTNATTALTQYNTLQEAIRNNTTLEPALKQAYDEFQSERLDDTTIHNIHSDKWDGGKGFNSIGDSDKPFTGTIDGFSGERVFGISNLTINRPEENNVGLVAVAGTSGNAAGFGNVHLYDTAITGKNNVGTIAGTLQSGSTISWSEVSGKVTGSGENIGGFAGLASGSSISYSSNYAAVDSKGTHVGGIAGMLNTNSTLKDVHNFGDISGAEDVGGLAGYVENSTIVGSTDAVNKFYNTYNNGTVNGTTNTGGIVGHAKGIYMYGVFNTNEDAPLSAKSQLIIDDSNTVIQRGDDKKDDNGKLISDAAGKTITDTDLQSNYGRVKGGTNTGGLVGYLEDAPDFSKTVTNSNVIKVKPITTTDSKGNSVTVGALKNNVIDTSYNAGNIEGKDSTGGLVGKMTGGTLSNVYNADNNTVLREQGTIPDKIQKYEISVNEGTTDKPILKTYKYSDAKASDCNNQNLTQYYSFFTVGSDGTRTYYYFLPVSTTSGTTQKGAGGIYVKLNDTQNGTEVVQEVVQVASSDLPATRDRYYFNRTFNKDANVKGEGANTGGLVGSMTTTSGTTAAKYSAGSVIDSAYNAGTITGSDTATTGALVGSKDAASLINDSFYVTGKDVTNGKVYSNVDQVVGTSSTDTSNITNTAALDAVESKKKYYVSDDSKRTNFPGVQPETKEDPDNKSKLYYVYASTTGTFYTDGSDLENTKNIYTVVTKDGKTTRDANPTYTQQSYTKQAGGTVTCTFADASKNTYNATYDTATRQIVLTPTDAAKATTVVLNAVLQARTANETWTIYEDQTRPLLTAFLNNASLSRTFNYDGTTHNLKTDDVANLYGRADFDGNAGKDVQLSNYQLSSNGVSSEYTYDNTSIWSPQHGYYMDPESVLVINPVNMSANLYGTRVYGDIFNTRGYYVCVPYQDGKETKYSFYKPKDNSTTQDAYEYLEGDELTKLFTNAAKEKLTPSKGNLLKIAEEKGFYVLELNGFINGEGRENLGTLITGLVTTLSNSDSTKTTAGTDLQHLFTNGGATADTYLDAGIYNVTDDSGSKITGLTATNQNYTINYGGTLTVKQAELYYTYDGSREYGLQNTDSKATHTYTLVGVDSGKDETTKKYTSTHGFLKSWDFGTANTEKNTDGTITNTGTQYADFFIKGADGKWQINQKYIGVKGYTATDTTGSADLIDIYRNLKGKINTKSVNQTSTDNEKVIGSYQDAASAKNDSMYTHVLIDSKGNPIGYKVTSFQSSNTDAANNHNTIQLYFKTDAGKSSVTEDAVNKLNQNYKLVWMPGGMCNKVYTIGNPEEPTPAEDAGIRTTINGLEVKDSTFTILPKTATVTITGNRAYGDTMDTSSYSTTVGSITAGLSKDKEQYNINIDGLTNGDTTDILDKGKTTTLLLEKIDQAGGNAADATAQINKYTNVKRERDAAGAAEAQNINRFEKSKISVVNGDASTDNMNVTSTTTTNGTTSTTTYDNSSSILKSNNYDYILQDGTHQLKITPVSIKVTVEGSKTYGDFTSQAATDYTARVSGGDPTQNGKVTLKTGEVADIVIANKLNEQSDAGKYSFNSTTSPYKTDGAFTISLSNDSVENANKKEYVAGNYDLSFETTYTIDKAPLWYTYEGSRNYGEDNTTTKNTFKLVGVDGADSNERVRGFLKPWDVDAYKVDTAHGNTIALTPGKADAATLYAMTGMANDAANVTDTDKTTIRSITGGSSHVIVNKDGKVIGYNLSSLGLAQDSNGKASDVNLTLGNIKDNYQLIWKSQVQAGTDGKGTILSSQTTTASVKDANTNVVSTNAARTVDVGASTLTINPVNLTVEVTGKRQYGHTMTDSYQTSIGKARVTAGGVNVSRDSNDPDTFLENGTYNLNLNGLAANDDASVLDTDKVKAKLREVEGDGKDTSKINKYTAVRQGTTDNLATKLTYNKDTVHAFDITKRDDNTENKNSQITVTDTTNGHYNLLKDGNYDYKLVDGTHTLTIDRQDLNLDIKAKRKYGDISNQKYVSDYKNDAIAYGTTPSYATGITVDGGNGLQNGETIDFTKSTVSLSDNFAQADAGTYTHNWYNDDNNKSTDYSIGNKGITNITLVESASDGSKFDAKNYNIHYTTTYTVDKADLYYTYDGERNYGQDNSEATHTYTIVGQDGDSSKESVRGYLKSWDSGVLAGGNVLNKDLLTVTNADGNGDGNAYTMTGVAIQDAGTQSADNAANIAESERNTSQSIGKNNGYSHVIVDNDGKILSYTIDSLGTTIAGKDSAGTLAKNYNLVWKQGGDSNKLDKVYTTAATNQIDGNGALQATTDTVNKITVNNSSFKINPLALTVTVTGKRYYGDTMAQGYTTGGTLENGKYNITVTPATDFANGETADRVLNQENVEKMLKSLENDTDATRENSNGETGKISKYTDVKRNADDKSKVDSYSLKVGSTDTSSTITLASKVKTDAKGKVTSIEHADKADSSHGFNVLNNNNYDYVIRDGKHTLTINPVDLTVNVKGESTYGKTDTKYTVTSTGAKNGETMIADSGTLSNLVANSPAGSYTANEWTNTTGAATSKATAASGKYLNTAELRTGKKVADGTDTDKGIYQVQLKAGENSTFNANNYNITYRTTQVINPEKLTITIDGTKVYGSQPTGLTTGNMKITSGELATDDSLAGLTIADNMNQLTDVGTYHHNWSMYAGGNVPAESYTYEDADGQTHTGNSTATSWITGVDTSQASAFDINNYDVDFQSTYEVTKRPLQLDVTSTSIYGDPKAGYTYTATALDPTGNAEEGLVGNQNFNPTDIEVTDDITAASDAGTYTHTAAGTSYTDASNNPQNSTYKGITAVEADSLKDAGNTGFKSSNYDITLHQGTHTVEKRTVHATVSGSQVYGESAPTNGEAYDIAFEMAGGTGVAAGESLANGQKIDKSQVTVQNSVSVTNDFGTYTTSQSDVGAPIAYGNNPERVDGKDQGIYGITVTDGNGFKNNNYNIVLKKGSYEVTKRPVTFLTTGSRTYGEENATVKDYTIQQLNTAAKEGLTGRNDGTVTADEVQSLKIDNPIKNNMQALTDAGTYGTESDSAKQVLDIDESVQKILGDDYKNYAITYQDAFTINPRTVRVTIAGESTYGDAARAAGTDYKAIDFERSGADGVAPQEGLVDGQTIDKSQVTVQTNGIDAKTDAGTYHLSQSAGTPGISGIKVTDGNGFQNKNYTIVIEGGTYTVNKRPLTLTIKGKKTYGDPTSLSGRDYTVSQSGLQNRETIDFNDATVLHSTETRDRFSDAGEYHSSDNKGILGFDDSTLHGDGFKLGNYELTYDTVFVIDKRPVDVYMESRRTSGSPSSLRMDEPMTMRNVPQEHQGRFLSDMQILDTAPQVIAAGDYPGEDGTGYLDLSFAGDIYRNYMIHRHTVYHILPDRMMKPSIYNAVQPVRRPILDVMYLKVNGSEGINRWSGVEASKDDGAIILKDGLADHMNQPDQPDQPKHLEQPNQPNQPVRPVPQDGMGGFHEEVNQAVPVVYTDGENKELGGRYHLAYENNAVVVRPTSDTAEVPTLRAASVAQEEHKVLRVPYHGTEGEYAVAYADGIVQLYPQNDTARQLAKAKGGDEQLLLRSGLDSAVQQLGIQLEDVEAVYIFTK